MPRWLRDTRVNVGLAILFAVLLLALLAPLLVQSAPDDQDLLATLLPSAWAKGGDAAHPLGTDSLGRDVLARLLYGTRLALTVAAIAAPGAMILGTVAALLAGYFGGWVDWVIGRAVDVWMSFPPVILSLILMVGLGTGSRNVILAIVLVDWTRFLRSLIIFSNSGSLV